MKRMFVLGCCLSAAMIFAQDTVSLQVKDGLPGHDTANNRVNIDQMNPTSDDIVVQVVVSDLSYVLAGAEFELKFAPFLTFLDPGTNGVYDTGESPMSAPTDSTGWNTTSLQFLPANSSGQQTDTTFNNASGVSRVGIIVTNDQARLQPGSGPFIIAELTFKVGTLDSNPAHNGITDNNCISSQAAITLTLCGSGSTGSSCEIFADNAATARTMTAGNTSISLVHASALEKGNLTNAKQTPEDGGINIVDIVQLSHCVQDKNSANCALGHLSDDEFEQVTDINCSTATTPDKSDMDALAQMLLGQITSFSKRSAGETINIASRDGVMLISGKDRFATAAAFEFSVAGKAKFDDLFLSPQDMRRGWNAVSGFLPERGLYRVIVYNYKGVDSELPELQIPFINAQKASLTMVSASYAAGDGVMFQDKAPGFKVFEE